MSTKLDKMRQKNGSGQIAAAEKPSEPPKPAKVPGKVQQRKEKPRPEVIGTEVITHSCGHPGVLEHFPAKADKFRDARRAKKQGSWCPECKAKDQAARAVKNTEKLRRYKLPERLPDQSQFVVEPYYAEGQTWSGYLKVPGHEPFGPLTRSGIFRLLRDLDQMYRDAVAAAKGESDGFPAA